MTKESIDNLDTVKAYYGLTKPGIIRGNLITAVAGFLYAAQGSISFGLLIAISVGVSSIIASACVFNNYIDRDIDSKMNRTKNRALVTGAIKTKPALLFASLLGVFGLTLLIVFVNPLTACIGILAFFSYVALYGYAKRKSVYGTIVGSLPGALSLVAGYTAVTNTIDGTAWLLLLIMAIWQLPHFYAIAIYRMSEYKAAGLPVISIKRGVEVAKKHIVIYIVLYGLASSLLHVYSYAGYTYLVAMLAMSLGWLWVALKGYSTKNVDKWAKSVFGFSLLVLLVFSLLISINNFLP